MPFDTLSPKLQKVANAALSHFTKKFGRTGLNIEKGINPTIPWRPTFLLKPKPYHIIAVEVEDAIYPQVLKMAARDLMAADVPVSAYTACPLDVYLADRKQQDVRTLKSHGIGLYTVDEDDVVTCQFPCVPLVQFVSEKEFKDGVDGLPPTIRVLFDKAYGVYAHDAGQGLQDAGQIVEAMIDNLFEHAKSKNWLNSRANTASGIIDALYDTANFKPHRAGLGNARNFMKRYRNPVSHPPKNTKEALAKMHACKAGVVAAMEVARDLRVIAVNLKIRFSLYT